MRFSTALVGAGTVDGEGHELGGQLEKVGVALLEAVGSMRVEAQGADDPVLDLEGGQDSRSDAEGAELLPQLQGVVLVDPRLHQGLSIDDPLIQGALVQVDDLLLSQLDSAARGRQRIAGSSHLRTASFTATAGISMTLASSAVAVSRIGSRCRSPPIVTDNGVETVELVVQIGQLRRGHGELSHPPPQSAHDPAHHEDHQEEGRREEEQHENRGDRVVDDQGWLAK